jgi:predicted sulfurtransferase
VAKLHVERCGPEGWNLTGKVRIAKEGLNVTLAGTLDSIEGYMDWYAEQLQQDQSLLSSSSSSIGKPKDDFFKPSQGCRHVFSDQLSIKTVDEICPLRQPSITLHHLTQQQHLQQKLSPSDFHQLASKAIASDGPTKDMVLLDTRNYYESKIGQFKNSITPPIRKFSVFPSYVEHHRQSLNGKTILTYCTG